MKKKASKPHTSAKKASNSSRTKNAGAKTSSKSLMTKSKGPKPKRLSEKERKKLAELTVKMFQTVYDDYQAGKFHKIF
jgi:hypothetical protein